MGDGNEIHLERAQGQRAAHRHFLDPHPAQQARFLQLSFDQDGGEGRGIDGAFEQRPQRRDGADMILVRMGGDNGQHIFGLFGQKADIGHDDIHAGCGGFAPEQHAAIHDDPFAPRWRAKAIGVEIHADLARAAKRQEDQFVAGIRCVHYFTALYLFAPSRRGRE